jgi:hypothetical protein
LPFEFPPVLNSIDGATKGWMTGQDLVLVTSEISLSA